MGLDIRLPIGLLFALLGAILAVYGAVGDPAIYARSLGYNVNLVWGVVLLVFGSFFLWLGRRGIPTSRPAELDPEGREIERMEYETGKESSNPVAGGDGA